MNLAALPSDLRDILTPDPGEVWLGWDWSAIEERLLAALANDRPMLEAFEQGYEVHTLTTCEVFGWPYPPDRRRPHDSEDNAPWRQAQAWQGAEDGRRTFAKRFKYRLNYGGDAARAGDIPGSKTLGLTAPKLVSASRRYLAAHPALAAWRLKVRQEALRTRISRDFMGRRRRLLGDRRGIVREAFNHPMQGGVASIFNETCVTVARELPWLTWVYGMHDSQWWACPAARVEETWPRLKAIVTKPWNIQGVLMSFPASWKERQSA